MHDVACEFSRAVVGSKNARKQLARTSLLLIVVLKLESRKLGYVIHVRTALYTHEKQETR